MCGLDGEVVVYIEAGHAFFKCVTTHSPLKNAELNVSPHYTLITQRSQAVARTSHASATSWSTLLTTPLCAATNRSSTGISFIKRNVKKWGATPRASLQFCVPQVWHTSGFTAAAGCPRPREVGGDIRVNE
jgi:hypothetical protein